MNNFPIKQFRTKSKNDKCELCFFGWLLNEMHGVDEKNIPFILSLPLSLLISKSYNNIQTHTRTLNKKCRHSSNSHIRIHTHTNTHTHTLAFKMINNVTYLTFVLMTKLKKCQDRTSYMKEENNQFISK